MRSFSVMFSKSLGLLVLLLGLLSSSSSRSRAFAASAEIAEKAEYPRYLQDDSTNMTDAENSCYMNLTDLNADIDADQTAGLGFLQRTYVLCPNTIFSAETTTLLPIRNSWIICGASGESTNNCTITGGATQLAIPGTPETVTNVLLQGLTFEKARILSFAMSLPGDVTFRDCIWKDFSASFTILVVDYDTSLPTRKLQEDESNFLDSPEAWYLSRRKKRRALSSTNNSPRDLQDSNEVALVNILNSTFVMNEPASLDLPSADIPHSLLSIFNAPNILNIEDTLFHRNGFDDPFNTPHSLVSVENGSLSLKRNCFIDNDIEGFGMVEAYGVQSLEVEENFVTAEENLSCSLVASADVAPDITLADPEITCVGISRTSCSFDWAPAPTNPPVTLSPSPAEPPDGTSSSASVSGSSIAVATMAILAISTALSSLP